MLAFCRNGQTEIVNEFQTCPELGFIEAVEAVIIDALRTPECEVL